MYLHLQFKPPPNDKLCEKRDCLPECGRDGDSAPSGTIGSKHRDSPSGQSAVIPQRLQLGDSANLDELGSHGAEENFTVDPVQVRLMEAIAGSPPCDCNITLGLCFSTSSHSHYDLMIAVLSAFMHFDAS